MSDDHLRLLLTVCSRDVGRLEELVRYLWTQLPLLAQWHVCERYGLPAVVSRTEDDPDREPAR